MQHNKSMTETAESLDLTSRLNNLSPETRVTLYPLVMRLEDEEYIVGRAETGEFVALPEVGGRIIELFQHGHSLGEAQAQLQQEYDAEIDLDDFVANLVELGFVQALDGHRLETAAAPRPNLAWLQARHVRWLFSRPVQFIYLVLLLAAALTLITHPELFPRYQDFFWSPITSLVILVNTAIVMTNLALHELAHLAAARSLGVPARIGLGTRLHNLVVQTDVTGLWAVPRHQRYRVYLAGMAWNLFSISVALLLLAYAPLATLARDLLQALVLGVFLGVLWQFEFYMRTDMYFVIMDLLRCHNLFEDSLAYLRYRARRLWRRVFPSTDAAPTNPLDHLPTHEQRKVSLYAWFVLIGSTVSLLVFALYGLPILIELFVKAGRSVRQGITGRQLWPFLDGAVTLAIEGGLQVAFVVTFLRNRRGWFTNLRRAIARR